MKFSVERTFLVRTYEEVELNPKNFIHCATIEELNNEIEDYINRYSEHPTHPGFQNSEEIGTTFWDNWFNDCSESFYIKWQELKGLPTEL